MITTASFCAGSLARIMPPKRRAASAAKAGGKKAKEQQPAKPKDAFTSAKEALLAAGPQVKGKRKVDEHCSLSGSGEVRQAMCDIVLFIAVTCSKVCAVIFKEKNNVLCCLCQVYEDYDCMLNQTNIGHNNNKFYIIQIIQADDGYYSWNRWGRVVSFAYNRFLLKCISFCFVLIF